MNSQTVNLEEQIRNLQGVRDFSVYLDILEKIIGGGIA